MSTVIVHSHERHVHLEVVAIKAHLRQWIEAACSCVDVQAQQLVDTMPVYRFTCANYRYFHTPRRNNKTIQPWVQE